MVHSIIWLTLLGVALVLPNLLAVRLALIPEGGFAARPASTGGVAADAAAPAKRATRVRTGRPSPQFVRRGYLWKALSPLLFGLAFVLGLAIGGLPGYIVMGVAFLNLLLGFWGWDAYVPGKMGKR